MVATVPLNFPLGFAVQQDNYLSAARDVAIVALAWLRVELLLEGEIEGCL